MNFNLLNAGEFIFGGKFYDNHITLNLFGEEFPVYFYGMAIVFGIIACCIFAVPLFKKRGEKPDFILDLMICIVPIAVIMSRVWYVLFALDEFIDAPEGFFKAAISIRDGGLAIYGGVLGGAIGIIIACKIHKVPIGKVMDFGGTLLPLGQLIGRWGNFFNQEVYGQEITNPKFQFFPVGVEIGTPGKWYQALFLYEGFLNLIVFITLYTLMLKYKGKSNGYFAAAYLFSYGLIRGILETFRQSEFNLPLFGIQGIRGMVVVSILLMICSGTYIVLKLKKDGLIFKGEKENK